VTSMIAEHAAEVWVRRYNGVPECDVVVAVRGQEMSLGAATITKQSNGPGSNASPTRLTAGSL
jgi:hypothetical protein